MPLTVMQQGMASQGALVQDRYWRDLSQERMQMPFREEHKSYSKVRPCRLSLLIKTSLRNLRSSEGNLERRKRKQRN